MKKALIAAMGLSGLCGMASADVVITEIFYNLNGSESGATEWVEIYNNGSLAIDMSGWVYGDSQDGVFAGGFAAGTVLGAGEVAVLCFQPEAVFQSIWGAGVRVIQLDTEVSLANSASATNETVALFDASNTLVDEVNFEVGTNGWPGSANGVSISLNADALDASLNDLGASWSITQIGVNGGREALIINPDIANATAVDISSAGVVPAPGALALVGLGGLVAGRRRRA